METLNLNSMLVISVSEALPTNGCKNHITAILFVIHILVSENNSKQCQFQVPPIPNPIIPHFSAIMRGE
jgi:hypothetical protein